MNNLCVVIPVHKPELTGEEIESLTAAKNHLTNFECFLVFPRGMDTSAYMSIFKNLALIPVEPNWLSSVEQYNRMKLNLVFYEMFNRYTFMLTYELDAFIFHSDFVKTKAFSFDFIGAPLFEGYLAAPPDARFIQGCNSGFSIRNIQVCIKVLKEMKKYKLSWLLYRFFLSNLPRFRYHLNRITKEKFDVYINGKLTFYFGEGHINEDQVWTQIVPYLFKYFKVADYASALQFSFEHNPERLLILNHGELPLGCHAWPKYNNFWKQYITN